MSYMVPYSFTPGTKARAQEMNANFSALIDFFDTLDSAKVDINLSNISSQGINVIKNNSSIRNLGEIIVSPIPLCDSGLHLLDGSLINDNGIYKDFVKYIKELYNGDPTSNYFTTEAAWQTSVTTYGVCGKFVYDSENNTVRLPKVTGIIEGTTDISALGDLVEAGLPNITGTTLGYPHWNNGAQFATSTTSGAFSHIFRTDGASTSVSTNSASSSYGTYIDYNIFDASLSSSIYGNSTTVQPQTIKMLYYIVIATSSKTDIQVDIDDIATDLNGKADVDLTNTAATLSNTFLSKLMPDYENTIDITATVTTSSTQNRSYPYPIMLYFSSSCQGLSGGHIRFTCGNFVAKSEGYGYSCVTVTVFVPANTNFTLYYPIYPDAQRYAYIIPLKGANQ